VDEMSCEDEGGDEEADGQGGGDGLLFFEISKTIF